MPRVDVNGLILHVQELGSGPPVVMLHGLLVGSLAAWYFTAAPTLAADHRVIMYDLRGHGRSERAPSGYDLATQVEDLRGVLAVMGVREPAVLVGHSYGALIALQLALLEPSAVKALALVEPPLPPSRFSEIEGFLARGPEAMVEALPGPLRELLGAGGGGRRARKLLDSLAFLTRDSTLLADLAREPDIPDAALARLTLPVLGLFGDTSACRDTGARLARVLPHATIAELPGGHYLHLDQSREVTSRIQALCHG